jgi:hypothetical protein
MSYFSYYEGKDVIPEGSEKISPSRLSRFFDDTSNWYRETLLGEDPVFQGSTASHLGTVVHGMGEMYVKTGEMDHSLAEEYIDSIGDPEVNKDYIRMQYPVMAQALVTQFLSQVTGEAEPFLFYEVIPGVGVGGSIDLLRPTEIVDYKTTGALSAPNKIPRAYWFQQMAYVWLARKRGMDIKSFRIVYITTNITGRVSESTGKALKDYPTTVTSLVHEVTSSDLEIIDSVTKLVAHSVKSFKEKPELQFLLAQDFRLKKRVSFNSK